MLNVYGANVPLAVFLEEDPVGEALSADTDPLQNPVTPQLVQDQVGTQLTSLEGGTVKREGTDQDQNNTWVQETERGRECLDEGMEEIVCFGGKG